MYGTPDQVLKQVRRFYDRVGGFDHLLVMQQAGFLDHARTVRSMTLSPRRSLPRSRISPARAPTTQRAPRNEGFRACSYRHRCCWISARGKRAKTADFFKGRTVDLYIGYSVGGATTSMPE
jgi:hypothetical protein